MGLPTVTTPWRSSLAPHLEWAPESSSQEAITHTCACLEILSWLWVCRGTSKTWRKGVSRSFIWNGGFECWCHVKGEDILERALVPEEGWMGQREESRLFRWGSPDLHRATYRSSGLGCEWTCMPFPHRVYRALSYSTAQSTKQACICMPRESVQAGKTLPEAWRELASYASHTSILWGQRAVEGLHSLSESQVSASVELGKRERGQVLSVYGLDFRTVNSGHLVKVILLHRISVTPALGLRVPSCNTGSCQ